MRNFSHRSNDIEIMDDLNCSGEVVYQTLRELETINKLLGGNYVTLQGITSLLKGITYTKPVVIGDLGCGSGDMLKLISQWSSRNGKPVELIGVDANPNIIDFAKKNTEQFPIRFETLDIFSDAFRRRQFDLLTATLFLHHFSEAQLIDFFSQVKHQVRIGMIINDIHRHWFAYHSIRILTRLFSKSVMVKFDAPLSVLRAFRRQELESILQKAGIKMYSIRWMWAFRWQVIIPAGQ